MPGNRLQSGLIQPLPEPWVLVGHPELIPSSGDSLDHLVFRRVLLNIMYLIVETVRQEAEGDKPEWKSMRQTFRAELGEEQALGG